jgi:OmpA-OmpF porin, OOP family
MLLLAKKLNVSSFIVYTLLTNNFCDVQSQNLIPNCSFEEKIDFDTAKIIGWHKVQHSDTPDYFNFYKNTDDNVFNEFIGGTNAKSGNGFAGIFCYRADPIRSIRNIREYISSSLICELEKDSLYKFEISLLLDAESNVAIRNFGAYFSDIPIIYNKDSKVFSLKPQIEFNSVFLDSTNSWMTLQSFYKANGSEKFITVGNFKSDKNTKIRDLRLLKDKKRKKKWDLASSELATYYYLDDLLLEKVHREYTKPIESDTFSIAIADTFDLDKIIVDSAIVLENVNFDFNKSELLPESYKEIDKLYKLLYSNPNLKIRLEGHTDNVGSYEFNLQLSMRRVQSVAKYLVEKGITGDRIEFAGYSFSCPLVINNTDKGRRINRRVAFKIIEK